MRRRAFTTVEFIGVVAVIGLLSAILFLVFARRQPRGQRSVCQSNLKQIGLGFLQYTQDYDEKYPILTTQQGWFGALQPYLKSTKLFQCPEEKTRGKDNLTDYWLNQRLAGAELKKVTSPATTLMSGDGEPSDDANISLTALPPLWATKKNSPARRHLDFGNYLFADGHVKAYQPNQITLNSPMKNQPTFLLKP